MMDEVKRVNNAIRLLKRARRRLLVHRWHNARTCILGAMQACDEGLYYVGKRMLKK